MDSALLESIAKTHGTPVYVYDWDAIRASYLSYATALSSGRHLVCYAVKANSNIAILQQLARLGCGFDIVSGGELQRVLRAGADPSKIVFSGVGKCAEEIRMAAQAGILCFNAESFAELEALSAVASGCGGELPIAIRVNPNIDAKTHPYISTGLGESKFGIQWERALEAYKFAARLPALKLFGMSCHIGSQMLEAEPMLAAADSLLDLLGKLKGEGIELRHLDLGGGLGVRYKDETPPSPEHYIRALVQKFQNENLELCVEPGRSIIARSGVLLTKVLYLKRNAKRNLAIVDAGMNDLIRPALYEGWHPIEPLRPRQTKAESYDIVGPVCESGDFLGLGRELALEQGDLLAVGCAGAYGFSMSSNYNSRPRAAECLIHEGVPKLIRERETFEDLIRGERLLGE